MDKIRVGLIGVGNCASSLVQGVYHYASNPDQSVGLMNRRIAGYGPEEIEFSAAFDVNTTKVGMDLGEAIFAEPNNTIEFHRPGDLGVPVVAGPRLDGIGDMAGQKVDSVDGPLDELDVVDHLKSTKTNVVVNYLPVGSQAATEFYARCAIQAGCAFVNSIPVFIARDPAWRGLFSDANLPLIGDDIKSQFGATIVHRVLAQLLGDRGMQLLRTYQLNVGGNMDFFNMLEQGRLTSKRESKSSAVIDVVKGGIEKKNVHIGPSDYVEWLGDRKLAFIRLEAAAFGGVPLDLELRMNVWDSPNSAGVVIDAVRYAKVALDRKIGGALADVSGWLMKAPPEPMTDDEALRRLRAFAGVD